MRQQDLRCPFLVISGGNECYHNPLSRSFILALSLALFLFPVSYLNSFSAARQQKGFPSVFLLVDLLLASLVYLCQYSLVFFCFDWPFHRLLLPPLLHGRPCGLTAVWHSVWVIGLSGMMCKESLSSSKTHRIVRLWYFIRASAVRELRLASG